VWQRGVADESFGNMKRMLNAIMMTLLVLVLILCFFSLLTTTHANIRSQQKEIGVLMVLGYEKTRILRVYIYEAFVLVANSCCKGFVAGYIVATIMAWQRELFSSVTVTLDFKTSYLAVIFAFAVASSLLATYRALKDTLNKKISDLLSVYN
jgi:ABC-type lipoprotein release transport system permease subunit